MATGVNGIATYSDIYEEFGVGTSTSQCPTQSIITNLGLTVASGYSANQCVKFSDISLSKYDIEQYISAYVLNMNNSDMVSNYVGNLIMTGPEEVLAKLSGRQIVLASVNSSGTVGSTSTGQFDSSVGNGAEQILTGTNAAFKLSNISSTTLANVRVQAVLYQASLDPNWNCKGTNVQVSIVNQPTGSGGATGNVTLSFINNGYSLYYNATGTGTGTALTPGKPGSVSISSLSNLYLRSTSSNVYLYLSRSGNNLSQSQYDHRQFVGTSWTKLSYTGWTSGYTYNFTAFNG